MPVLIAALALLGAPVATTAPFRTTKAPNGRPPCRTFSRASSIASASRSSAARIFPFGLDVSSHAFSAPT